MLKTILVVALVFSSAVHAKKNTKSKKTIDDREAVSILARNCAGCHQEADHPGALLLNAKRLSEPETLKLMRRLIDTEQMPPVHQDFKKSKDGKALLSWLEAKELSALKPAPPPAQ